MSDEKAKAEEAGARLSAWVEPEVAAAIRAEAMRLDRSISWVVAKVLEERFAAVRAEG